MSQQHERALVDVWIRCLREAVEALTGEPPEITIPANSGAPTGALRWWRQRLDHPEGAWIWVGASEATAASLGGRVLQAAGVGDADAGQARGTYFEILQQATSATAVALGARFGRELRALDSEEVSGQAPAESWELRLALPGQEPSSLWVAFEGLIEPVSQPAEEAALVVTGTSSGRQPIDLLLDVELPVSVSFGRTQLPLKEVLKLTSGSIVELNRPVAEPVEVIVNNCVIARGEVVVVEGNYGVRITEIVSRQQRLRTLG